MMIFDSHIHSYNRNLDPEALLKSLAQADISRTATTAVSPAIPGCWMTS